MNDDDLTRLAGRLRACANLLETRGTHALDVAASWRGTTKAATFEPHRGQRTILWCWTHERDIHACEQHDLDCDGDPIIAADPTGEASSTTADQLRHPRLVAAIGALDITTGRATNLILNTVPRSESTRLKTPGDGWCSSCYRDNQYLEPEDIHRDGRVKHKGMCAWCAIFRTNYGRLPPFEILERRHRGQRISKADVIAAFKPKPKGKRKKAS